MENKVHSLRFLLMLTCFVSLFATSCNQVWRTWIAKIWGEMSMTDTIYGMWELAGQL
jgi:hypothetical protein